jgi:integrase
MSIRKRTWKGRDGEQTAWVVDYIDQAGKRRLKTFTTKKEADAWAVMARHEIKQGIHTPASTSKPVTEVWELWIADCEANELERSTIKQRREHLRLHVAPFLGDEKLSVLTMPRIVDFVDELRSAGRSLAMRRKVVTNLKTVLTFAQSRGWVAQNVARGVKVKSDSRNTETGPLRAGRDFPSRQELRTIMEAATGRWRPLVITAIFTGMRASELRGLSWANVDLETGMIHIRQRADAWGTIGKPKSRAGNRDIPLTPMVINTLKEWRATCPSGPLDLVFPNGHGNIESHQNIVHRFWEPIQIKSGLALDTDHAKYGFHSLRHAAASLFIAHLGWTPKRVQTVLGHSSIRMSYDLYGHLFEDRESDQLALEKLEAAVVAA